MFLRLILGFKNSQRVHRFLKFHMARANNGILYTACVLDVDINSLLKSLQI